MSTRVAVAFVVVLALSLIASCKQADPNPVLEVAIGPYDTVVVRPVAFETVTTRSAAKPDSSGFSLAYLDDQGIALVEIEMPPERRANGLRILRITSNCPQEFDVVVEGFEEWRLEIDAGRSDGRTVPAGKHVVHVIEVSSETPSRQK